MIDEIKVEPLGVLAVILLAIMLKYTFHLPLSLAVLGALAASGLNAFIGWTYARLKSDSNRDGEE